MGLQKQGTAGRALLVISSTDADRFVCFVRVQKRSYRPTARTDDVINNRVQTEAENARRADVTRTNTKQPYSAAVSLPVYTLHRCRSDLVDDMDYYHRHRHRREVYNVL